MSTQKRRIVYMDDRAWEQATLDARARNMTTSAYLRGLAVHGDTNMVAGPERPVRPMTQAERDAILRKINRAGR